MARRGEASGTIEKAHNTANDFMWAKLALRLAEEAYKTQGTTATVTVRMVLKDGKLVGWEAPQITVMEPYSNKEEIAEALLNKSESLDPTGSE